MIEDGTPITPGQAKFMDQLHLATPSGMTKFQAKHAIDVGIIARDAKKDGIEATPIKPGQVQAPHNPLQDEKTRNINMCVAIKGAVILCCADKLGGLTLIQQADEIFNYLIS